MKDIETQQQFIQLRSQGRTFAEIAQALSVSKQTLISWSQKLRFEIQNLRAIEREALQHQLIDSHETRACAVAEQLRKVEAELATRNLETVSTARLYSLAASLRKQILQETGHLQFTSPLKDIPDADYYEQAQDWTP
jgi:hypothetical protein